MNAPVLFFNLLNKSRKRKYVRLGEHFIAFSQQSCVMHGWKFKDL